MGVYGTFLYLSSKSKNCSLIYTNLHLIKTRTTDLIVTLSEGMPESIGYTNKTSIIQDGQ